MRRSSYGSRGCRTALQRIFLHPGRVIVLREVVANPGLLVGARSVRQHVLAVHNRIADIVGVLLREVVFPRFGHRTMLLHWAISGIELGGSGADDRPAPP